MVDFVLMRQINILDLSKQRPIKRGAPGVRTVRPNDVRFTDNTKFLVQNFRAITLEKKEGESGGHWLGQQYKKKHSRPGFDGSALITVETLKKGITDYLRLHSYGVAKEDKPGVNASSKEHEIYTGRVKLEENLDQAWKDLIEGCDITDQDVREILTVNKVRRNKILCF